MDAVSAIPVSPRVMFEETENITLIARAKKYTMEEAIKTPPNQECRLLPAILSIKATRIVAAPENSSSTTDTARSHAEAQGGTVEHGEPKHGGPLYTSGINGTVNIKAPPTKANQRATIGLLLELPELAWPLSLEETAPERL